MAMSRDPLSFAPADGGEAAVRRWVIVNFNYTFSRTKDNLAARTGLQLDQDWAVGRQRSAARVECDGGLQRAVRRGRQARRQQPGRAGDCQRLADIGHHAVPIGPAAGSILAACNLPNAGTCYADFAPGFTGDVRINGDYGDGDVLGAAPPTYIDRAPSNRPRRLPTGNTLRTLAFDLRNPSSFNQDLSVRRDFRVSKLKLGFASTCSISSITSSSEASRPTSPMRISDG
jgi:hypothetical protein